MDLSSYDDQKCELDKCYRQTLIVVYSYKGKLTNFINKTTPQEDMEVLLKYGAAKPHKTFALIHKDRNKGIECRMIFDTKKTFILPLIGKYSGPVFDIELLKINPEEFMRIQVSYTKYLRELKEIVDRVRGKYAK